MWIKIHKTPDGRAVIAVCDEELLGKKVEKGKMQLHVTEQFYKGEQKEEEEIIPILKKGDMVNLVGEKAIALGIIAGVIDKDKVIRIKGIPHAQAMGFN